MARPGLDTLEGADTLKEAPKMYSSNVEYPDTPLAKSLKGIAQVHMAGFGTRIFYVDHGSFDSHSNQLGCTTSCGRTCPRESNASSTI